MDQTLRPLMHNAPRSAPPDVEVRAAAAGYRLARRRLKGQLVWWWQLVDDPAGNRDVADIQHGFDALDHWRHANSLTAIEPTPTTRPL